MTDTSSRSRVPAGMRLTRRTLLLGMLGGLVLFAWGAVSHVVLGLQDPVFDAFADETEVAEALAAQADGPGVYYLPYAEEEISRDRVRAFVGLLPPGTGPDVGRQFAVGLLIQMLAAVMVVGLAGFLPARRHVHRVLQFAWIGFIIAFTTHAFYWNWFGFSAEYAAMMTLDSTIGWALVGLAVTRPLGLSAGEA